MAFSMRPACVDPFVCSIASRRLALPCWPGRPCSATQHAVTGCQGIPYLLRQADTRLAMANSNGKDFMTLSDPIELQIVAEEGVFPHSSGLGW